MSLAVSLTTAVTALRAAQTAMDTAAHNIANANTDGYSREEVVLSEIGATHAGTQTGARTVQVGLGVSVDGIRRMHDDLLDAQYRGARALQDGSKASAAALQQAESTLNEPSDHGLQAALSTFFNGFSDLATQPESTAARTSAIQQGVTLAAQLDQTASTLSRQRTNLDSSIVADVSQINADATQVAQLNAQIVTGSTAGSSVNDLLDKRDKLLDDLSGLAGVTVQHGANDSVTVNLGGHALVDGVNVSQLKTVADPANSNLSRVQWAADGAPVTFAAGEAQGLLDARDVKVAGLMSTLDQLTQSLQSAVNAAHRAGYGLDNSTGLDFFTGTGAADIAVNATLVASPQKLATASAANEPGNADAANAIAGVQNARLLDGGTATIGVFYASLVAALGSASSQAQQMQDNQSALTAHIDSARQAISGVSIDEELTNLTQSQRAYQAAARIISVTDGMLDTLVNHTLV